MFFPLMLIRYPRLTLIIANNAMILLVGVIFYPLMFQLMNYPLQITETSYYHKWIGIPYEMFYGFIVLFAIFINSVFLLVLLKNVHQWMHFLHQSDHRIQPNEAFRYIENQCANLPYLIYVGQIVTPVLSIFTINLAMFLFNPGSFTDYLVLMTLAKLCLVIFVISTMDAIPLFLFSKWMFHRILVNIGETMEPLGLRIGLQNKIFLQIIPLFIVTILFTSLGSYSRMIEEKGLLLFSIYQAQLQRVEQNLGNHITIPELNSQLQRLDYQNSKDCHFIINPKGEIFTSNHSKLSSWFLNYIRDLSPKYGGLVKDSTGEVQGAVIRLSINGELWLAGIKYNVFSPDIVAFFLGSFLGLLLITIIVISYLSKSIAGEISLVTTELLRIVKNR